MNPSLFDVVAQSQAARDLIGNGKALRFWSFADAPMPGTALYGVPYSTWQVIYGSPDNFMNQAPIDDLWGVQFDFYAKTSEQSRQVRDVIRGLVETRGYLTSYSPDEVDRLTNLRRCGFTLEVWTDR